MGKIKTALSNTKSKLKNSINKNKGRIAAGVIAGSILLTSGLFGCSKQKNTENEDLKDQIANMQVENKSHEEQIALLKQELASLKEIPTANATRLEKVEELLTKLEQSGVSDEEFAASINVLMAEIEKQSNSAMDKVIQEVEKNNTSSEVKEDLIEVLTKLKEEVVYGVRTDYQAAFLQAERIENAVKKQKENNEIAEEQYNNIIGKVHEVQSSVIRVALYTGCESLTDKTSYTKIEMAGNEEGGKGYGKIVLDREANGAGNTIFEPVDGTDLSRRLMYVEGQEGIFSEDEEVWRDERTPYQIPSVSVYDYAYEAMDYSLSGVKIIDYNYSVADGYTISYNNYENEESGTINKQKLGTITVDFSKDGSLESIVNTYQTAERKGEALVELEKYSFKYKFGEITQAEFESFCQSVRNELQAKLDNQEVQE